MNFNYAIIIFGDLKIEGHLDDWSFPVNLSSANLKIDGVWYKTGVNNVLLLEKEA